MRECVTITGAKGFVEQSYILSGDNLSLYPIYIRSARAERELGYSHHPAEVAFAGFACEGRSRPAVGSRLNLRHSRPGKSAR